MVPVGYIRTYLSLNWFKPARLHLDHSTSGSSLGSFRRLHLSRGLGWIWMYDLKDSLLS